VSQAPASQPEARFRDDELLDPQFMRRLDNLDIVSRKMLAGVMQGERRSKRKGQSVEFADYRQYVAGDDLRFIDWNLYARLDKLFLRLFMEEEDLLVNIVLDCSASMDYGDPNKLAFGRKLVAALGYIGLTHYNRVSLYGFSGGEFQSLRDQRGRRPLPRMLEFLRSLKPGGAGDLEAAGKRFALLQQRKGVVVVISDFFDKGELDAALRSFGDPRFDTYAIQVLAPQEVDPAQGQIVGDLRLRDLEDEDVAEVSVTPALIKRYQANLQAYCQHVRQQCTRRGVAYMISDSSVPFETLVLQYLRQRGLLGGMA